MKRNTILILIAILAFTANLSYAQFGKIKRAIKTIEKEAQKEVQDKTSNNSSDNSTKTGSVSNSQNTGISSKGNTSDLGSIKGGQLVFSNQPIDPQNPTNLKTEFTAGEYIYALLILDKPFNEFIGEESVRDPISTYVISRPALKFNLAIDDQLVYDGLHNYAFSLQDKNNYWKNVPTEKYFFIDIAPDPAKQRTYGYKDIFFKKVSAVGREGNKAQAGAQYYSFLLSRLKPGKHTFGMSVSGKGNNQVLGGFYITGDDFSKYLEISNKLEEAAGANMELPASRWDNPQLASSISSAYKKLGGERVLKVIIVRPSWAPKKDAIGRIIYRRIGAVIVFKKPEGKCYMQEGSFIQYHKGGGRYGPTQQDGRSETQQLIPCEKIK